MAEPAAEVLVEAAAIASVLGFRKLRVFSEAGLEVEPV